MRLRGLLETVERDGQTCSRLYTDWRMREPDRGNYHVACHFVCDVAGFAGSASEGIAVPLPVTTKHIDVATKSQEIKIAYPHTGVAAIDDDIASAVTQWRKDYTGDVNAGLPDAPPNSLDIGFDIARNDSKMFVVAFNIYYYTGGAHPNTDFHTFNYLRADNARIYLPEIIGHDGIKAVSKSAIAQLKQQIGKQAGDSDTDWIEKGAGPIAENFASLRG